MQDAITADIGGIPKLNYLNNGFSLKSWLLTKDHKRIAIMYLITVSLFFFAGGLYAATIRLELLTPASDLLETGTYNKVFTQHGILMIFFFLIPSIPAVRFPLFKATRRQAARSIRRSVIQPHMSRQASLGCALLH